jgi:hypothetical protein
MKSTCYLEMKTRSQDKADSRCGNETLQEGVF